MVLRGCWRLWVVCTQVVVFYRLLVRVSAASVMLVVATALCGPLHYSQAWARARVLCTAASTLWWAAVCCSLWL